MKHGKHPRKKSPDPNLQSTGRKIEPLTLEQVRYAVSFELEDALGSYESNISEERRESLQYYAGKAFGNEVDGRSKAILTDVRDTVESILPSLIRAFTRGRDVARFDPKREEEQPEAEQATDYVNHVLMEENDGFLFFYNWFKDALIEKNGIGKVWAEEVVTGDVETWKGLDDEQVNILLADDDLVPVEHSLNAKTYVGPDPETGQLTELPTHDLKVRNMRRQVRVRVEGIPPEEFLIARRANKLDRDTPFCAHRVRRTASDLISMGYDPDVVVNLPHDDTAEYHQERLERRDDEEEFPLAAEYRPDEASREIWLTECYIRIDEDGDGYAELRRIVVAGEGSYNILEDEEVNDNPFVSLTPIPMPHKFYGLAFADIIKDLQLIRSTLLRSILDHVYLVNNPRMTAIEDEVNIDDLISPRPGGVVRIQSAGAVQPLEMPRLPDSAFATLEYLHGVKEDRTGITRYNQGSDASTLNQTATGITSIMEAAQQRIDMVARIFADTGVKQLFQKLLRTLVDSAVKDRVVRLRGKWITVDPRSWNGSMDVTLEVGLGTGAAVERVGNMQKILDVQHELRSMGAGHMVDDDHLYTGLKKFAEAIGFKAPEMFFGDPQGKKPPEPKPDPAMMRAQVEGQKAEANAKLEVSKLALDQKKADGQREVERYRIDSLKETEKYRIDSQNRIAREKLALEMDKLEMEAQKINAESAADRGNGRAREERV